MAFVVLITPLLAADLPSDAEIKSILKNYIERDHWGVGVVVGIVDASGTRIVSYGKQAHGDSPEVNGDTLFEIGSITKTFTTLLLEDMIQRGEMNLDDPVEKFLPTSFGLDDPAWGITKRLQVKFRLRGKVRTAEVKEGESLGIPAGAEVLRALYGNLPVKGQTVDVTQKVAAQAKNGELVIQADNALAAGEVALRVPAWGPRKITLRDLATHRSGLPRDLDIWTVGGMYDLLRRYRLPREPGRKVEYCNLGLSLLAHAIELKAGTNYEALLQQRICRPLNMGSTSIAPTPELRSRWAKSHGLENRETGDIFDASGELPGAGCIRSSVKDMLKYAAANLGLDGSPLTPPMEATHVVQVARAFGEADLGLAWWVYHRDGAELITHGGMTAGQKAFLGFDKKLKRAVVVLANRNDPLSQAIEPLGMYLLHPPAEQPPVVQVPAKVLDTYVGLYEFPKLPQAILAFRRDGDHLIAQFLNSTGDDWLPLSETEFTSRWLSGSRLKFTPRHGGQTTAAFTAPHQRAWNARKISDRVPDSLFEPMLKPMAAAESLPRKDSALQGTWEGSLRPWFWPFWSRAVKLRIAEPSPGIFRAELDVPSQHANQQPVSVIYHPPQVELVVKSGAGLFRGKISRDHAKMSGHLLQGHYSLGLTLRRTD